jgi:hypothetical protein
MTRREHPTSCRRGVTSHRTKAARDRQVRCRLFGLCLCGCLSERGRLVPHMGRVGDEGVTPPPLEGPRSARSLPTVWSLRWLSSCLRRGACHVVAGAVPPVIAVKAAPRLGCDCLDHHPVSALEAGLCEQVLDPDVVPSPRTRDAPGSRQRFSRPPGSCSRPQTRCPPAPASALPRLPARALALSNDQAVC